MWTKSNPLVYAEKGMADEAKSEDLPDWKKEAFYLYLLILLVHDRK